MSLTMPVVTVFAIAVFVLCRYAGLRVWHALICIVLGFYLAFSPMADSISRITQSLFRLL